jgi:HTH-type transcriptional regulator/antitoxin HipB
MDQIGRTSKQLGEIIRRHRRRRGQTQQELAAKVQLRQATISKLEAGEPATQLKTLLDTLSALGLEIVVRLRTRASTAEIDDIF